MKKVAVSIRAINNFAPDIKRGLGNLDYIHLDAVNGK